MNEIEVERQVDQMVRFIKQEAEEKANEIMVSAEEEFNIEKLQLLETEKAKIRKEYERRESTIEMKRKIEQSKQVNSSRIKVLQARENSLDSIVKEAAAALGKVAGDKAKYKSLLTDLLVQALYKLSEPATVVRVRQVDLQLIKEVLQTAKDKFQQAYGVPPPELTVDEKTFLAPPPGGKADDEFETSNGGVVVTSADGKIVCANTLDERLKIAYSQNLPRIRGILFAEA
eukprot:jgi/Botrbrau1/21223/Bobra.39_2s0024.1